jgi:hypothetical protein
MNKKTDCILVVCAIVLFIAIFISTTQLCKEDFSCKSNVKTFDYRNTNDPVKLNDPECTKPRCVNNHWRSCKDTVDSSSGSWKDYNFYNSPYCTNDNVDCPYSRPACIRS